MTADDDESLVVVQPTEQPLSTMQSAVLHQRMMAINPSGRLDEMTLMYQFLIARTFINSQIN